MTPQEQARQQAEEALRQARAAQERVEAAKAAGSKG